MAVCVYCELNSHSADDLFKQPLVIFYCNVGMLTVYIAITPRGICINYNGMCINVHMACTFLHMGIVVCNMFTDHCPSVRSACYTPHNTYNIVIGLVDRHHKSKWRFVVQLEELCFKFDNDNDDLEQNKQGVIVKNLASDTQSYMQGQS